MCQKHLKSIKEGLSGGYTLIEMVVAIAIFIVVLAAVVGTFVYLINSQRRAMAYQDVNDDVRRAVELIAREIRTGKKYNISQGFLELVNQEEQTIVIALDNGIIRRSVSGGTPVDLTSGKTRVTVLEFSYEDKGGSYNTGDSVTVYIEAESNNPAAVIPALQIQSTLTSRDYCDLIVGGC